MNKLCALAIVTLLSIPGTGHSQTPDPAPFLAIWRDSEGMPVPGRESGAPFLRIAIWNDGRVVYSADTNKWSHNLRDGRISPERIATLKKDLADSGVFALTGTTYLVPDAPRDCVMVDLGDRQQMLYWDERETPNYGININPQPHHREFIRCWKEVNALARAAIPAQSELHTNRFERPPASWRPKRPIQSR